MTYSHIVRVRGIIATATAPVHHAVHAERKSAPRKSVPSEAVIPHLQDKREERERGWEGREKHQNGGPESGVDMCKSK